MNLQNLLSASILIFALSAVGCTAARVSPGDVAAATVIAEQFDVVAALALTEPLSEAEATVVTAEVRALLSERAKLQSPEFVGWLLADPSRVVTYLDTVSLRYLSGREALVEYTLRTRNSVDPRVIEYDAQARAVWRDLYASVKGSDGLSLPADMEAKAQVVLSALTQALLAFTTVRNVGAF